MHPFTGILLENIILYCWTKWVYEFSVEIVCENWTAIDLPMVNKINISETVNHTFKMCVYIEDHIRLFTKSPTV